MSRELFPTQEDIDQVTSGDFSQVQTPAEAWGVTDEEIAIVDQEAMARAESLTEDDMRTARLATADDIAAEPLHGFRLPDEVVRKITEDSSAE